MKQSWTSYRRFLGTSYLSWLASSITAVNGWEIHSVANTSHHFILTPTLEMSVLPFKLTTKLLHNIILLFRDLPDLNHPPWTIEPLRSLPVWGKTWQTPPPFFLPSIVQTTTKLEWNLYNLGIMICRDILLLLGLQNDWPISPLAFTFWICFCWSRDLRWLHLSLSPFWVWHWGLSYLPEWPLRSILSWPWPWP